MRKLEIKERNFIQVKEDILTKIKFHSPEEYDRNLNQIAYDLYIFRHDFISIDYKIRYCRIFNFLEEYNNDKHKLKDFLIMTQPSLFTYKDDFKTHPPII